MWDFPLAHIKIGNQEKQHLPSKNHPTQVSNKKNGRKITKDFCLLYNQTETKSELCVNSLQEK